MPSCTSAAPSVRIQAGSLHPTAACLEDEIYSTSEPSSRVIYKDITDLGGGIDFVTRVTCCCSVHVPAGVAFIFHAGSDFSHRGCCRTPRIPSLTLQAGRR